MANVDGILQIRGADRKVMIDPDAATIRVVDTRNGEVLGEQSLLRDAVEETVRRTENDANAQAGHQTGAGTPITDTSAGEVSYTNSAENPDDNNSNRATDEERATDSGPQRVDDGDNSDTE